MVISANHCVVVGFVVVNTVFDNKTLVRILIGIISLLSTVVPILYALASRSIGSPPIWYVTVADSRMAKRAIGIAREQHTSNFLASPV